MTINGWVQIILYCAIVVALVKPLGWYLTRVFNGERTFLSSVLRPVELGLYRIGGIDEKREQDWLTYTIAMLLFHVGGFAILYALLRLQQALPFNPQDMAAVPPDLSFNTATSFLTNTNWQNYGGESTLSYLAQMLGLTPQNFLSAATGIALAVALVRGFARASARTVGNFWVDVTRCTLYVLLPICVVYTLFLVWQGIPQTLGPYIEATTLEGGKQTIAIGPVASQVAIKMLGTNGGGFFNTNASHPFENPTAVSNLVQTISIFALGAALTNVFGAVPVTCSVFRSGMWRSTTRVSSSKAVRMSAHRAGASPRWPIDAELGVSPVVTFSPASRSSHPGISTFTRYPIRVPQKSLIPAPVQNGRFSKGAHRSGRADGACEQRAQNVARMRRQATAEAAEAVPVRKASAIFLLKSDASQNSLQSWDQMRTVFENDDHRRKWRPFREINNSVEHRTCRGPDNLIEPAPGFSEAPGFAICLLTNKVIIFSLAILGVGNLKLDIAIFEGFHTKLAAPGEQRSAKPV